ncbi:MAG: hypothetical protein RLZZ450_247 [Pseudomonadota bacterium]
MSDAHPQLGSLLAGRYRLLRILGEGGMGVVFEAQHTLTEKRVALKWLHDRVANHPEARARLMREALITGRVSHPNVVQVHDVLTEGDGVFLVMELLRGETLDKLLDRGGTPLHELVALLLPAMRGVAAAHRQGVVHRDIHPSNVFLSRDPDDETVVPKVVDFGISKLCDPTSPSLTLVGTTLGTPQYMSYEQLCNAGDVDARADVYSFGVILYRAVTGRPPFEGSSFTDIAIKVGSATPPTPKSLRADLPTSLERLILWAMARDRDQRIDSMETFIRELEPFAFAHSFRAEMSVPDRSVPSVLARPLATPAPTAAAPSARPPRPKSSRTMVLSALVVVSLIGALLWSTWARVAVPQATGVRAQATHARSVPPAPPQVIPLPAVTELVPMVLPSPAQLEAEPEPGLLRGAEPPAEASPPIATVPFVVDASVVSEPASKPVLRVADASKKPLPRTEEARTRPTERVPRAGTLRREDFPVRR